MDSGTGFFGKVTSHGDFVVRRLPHGFVQPWDAWLQNLLHASRGQLGQQWLGTYLSSPIWRFALAPGVCGDNAWAGLLMPSVDRVGRHFPLTLAARVADDAPLLEWMIQGGIWYDQLESLALWSLQADFSLELFDATLNDISMPDSPGAQMQKQETVAGQYRNHVLSLSGFDQLSEVTRDLHAAPTAQTLWWTDGSEKVSPCVLQCQGLPTAASCTAMLDGQWKERGWRIQAAGAVSPKPPDTAP
ncbi:MAG TPA: type VI secretion system-associated protein TagF [Pseudomonas sp.]|jgi:type VI secretion system protein ImpM